MAARKAKKKASNRGGARPNSGPKSAASKALIADVNAACIATVTPWLPALLTNLKVLADGGYERETRKFEQQVIIPPAGSTDAEGKPRLPYTDMVLVEVKSETADRDRAANQYLLDRLLGKPTERKELSGQLGIDAPLSEAFELALAKVYAHVAPILALESDAD